MRKVFVYLIGIFFSVVLLSSITAVAFFNVDRIKSILPGNTDNLESELNPQGGARQIDSSLVGIPRGSSASSASVRGSSNPVYASEEQYNNLENILPNSDFVKDLPKDAIVWLRFYNFNSGERQWEHSYVLKKDSVTKGNTNEADLIIFIKSTYLSKITADNFCEIAEESNKNGDFGIETPLSDVKLAWKFKSMMEYKNCLGI